MIRKICEYCGDEFETEPWRSQRRFCSKSCASKNTVRNRIDDWRPDNSGENNPMFGRTQMNENSLKNLQSGFWKGKHHSDESNIKRSKALMGKLVSDDTKRKTRATCEAKGIWRTSDDPTYEEFKRYRRKVYYWTKQQPIHLLDHADKRGRKKTDYHLDHRFSIYEGFRNNIPPRVIGSLPNLEFLPAEENVKKGTKCSITIEVLYELLESCDRSL